MRRRVLKVASILLGLVAIAAFAGSVGETRLVHVVAASGPKDSPWYIRVGRGRVLAHRITLLMSSRFDWPVSVQSPSVPSWRNAWGFSYERLVGGTGLIGGLGHLAVPTYPLLILGVPLLAWGLYRPWNPHGPGLCPACGYDLRGTSGGACPECGERV